MFISYNLYMKHISWEKYFLGLVELTAQRSKDPNTKVGAIIVNKENKIVGLGYNGMPLGNDEFPWGRDGAAIDTKYPYVIHAEQNAILNTTTDTKGTTIYVSLFPCSNCAKFLVQAGVKEVVYIDDKYHETEDAEIARRILKLSNVKTRQAKKVKITID